MKLCTFLAVSSLASGALPGLLAKSKPQNEALTKT
jgi:hypothetical protein